ncbi:hypothetical protein GSU3546 [Geobacter sulfurreducens PCA]|uniref:Uncharacterized protein n=1 Tax=Geobacter sulfurreducens (strain ATCC 51573 / DSM 12127 / PCA) TaxID=243231 RepID=I7FKA1_GEOSL|nr:hypothetical protein GSU3546 [Geobacter sulfurreducens PCA]
MQTDKYVLITRLGLKLWINVFWTFFWLNEPWPYVICTHSSIALLVNYGPLSTAMV